MENLTLLDKILLSANVTENFHKHYAQNEEFKAWLIGILPQVEDCKNQEQNNPWHKYNVLDHILHSVEEMNKQTKDLPEKTKRLLAYSMFYHDIGKPKCHIVREKNGVMIDSFFNHNIESAKVVQETASQFGFKEDEIEKLEQLVLKHDTFMNLRLFPTSNPYLKQLTPEVVDAEIEYFNAFGDGKELLEYLLMIGKSDNLAQNEKMTADSLKLLETFKSMLESKQKTMQ